MTSDIFKSRRIYIPEKLDKKARLSLNAEQSHYLANVLRMGEGDFLRVFNAADGEWACVVASVKRGKTLIEIERQLREPEAEKDLTLFCAPLKKNHFDFLIMKATELGATRIQPVISERTQVRDINAERLRSIAIEAAEQSERLSIPAIGEPMKMAEIDKALPKGCPLFVCAEFGDAITPDKAFPKPETTLESVAFVTGPEGGFTEAELMALKKLPYTVAIRLGKRILRAETAAIAALACWQAISGDWKNPT